MRNRGNIDINAKEQFGKPTRKSSWIGFLIFAVAVGVNVYRFNRPDPDPDHRSAEYMATTNAEDELAQQVADRKFENETKKLPAESPKLYELYADRGYSLEAQKKFDQAEVFYKKMLTAAPYAYKTYDFEHRGEYEINYASMLQEHNRAPDAVKVLEETIANQSKALGPNNWVVAQTKASLASALDAAHDYKREEAVEKDLLQRMETDKNLRDRLDINVLQNLGDCYNHQGRKEEAKATYEKCLAMAKKENASVVVTYLESQLKDLHD